MPSPSNEPDLERLLRRARGECDEDRAWLGPGLPQRLSAWLRHETAPSPPKVAFVEVGTVSPSGVATTASTPRGAQHVIGLSEAGLDDLGQVLRGHDEGGVSLRRLICPVAVFDFAAAGPIVREVQRGLTAADLQARLDVTLWAGPDLCEWAAP